MQHMCLNKETVGAEAKWVSFGRLTMLVGLEEAQEMVEAGELECKPNPKRPSSNLYPYQENCHNTSAQKKKDIK
eukprot:9903664-Lingulodinium_polyedra.AAC.1